jgi:flagellar biosynthesis protein FlhG
LRVAVVDCDLGLGSDHLLLGTTPRVTLQQVLEGDASIVEALHATEYGPSLVPAAQGVGSTGDLTGRTLLALAGAVRRLAEVRDLVLLDAAAGISPLVILTLLAADRVALVTNPDIAALTDAYALVKCLGHLRPGTSMGLIVNRAAASEQAADVYARFAEVAWQFSGCSVDYLGHVPADGAVAQRRLGQPPMVCGNPNGPTSRAIFDVALRLAAVPPGLGPRAVADGADAAEEWAASSRPGG